MAAWQRKTTARLAAGVYLGLALLATSGWTAEVDLKKQATEVRPDPNQGKIITIEDAVRIGLENHPRIKAARERIGSQESVLGQQMSAYYPSVNFNNSYRTSNASGSSGTSNSASDTFTSQANFSYTLYNFGKREGNVQAARETLGAVTQDYQTTSQDIIFNIKQAYYLYLGSQAIVDVRKETVKNRELLVRQARGFYEVGTRAKIDVARAEANLFTAQADLIAAENGVKIAWVTLRNAMGVPRLEEQPVAKDGPEVEVDMDLAAAREAAFTARTELKSFAAQRRASDQLIATARRGHLPDLNFDAFYGRRNSSGSEDTFPLREAWQVQLSFNIPIFDGFRTTNRVQETLHNYNNLRAQEEDRRQAIALEVEQAYLLVVETQERVKATEAAVRAAKENVDLARGRYQVGVGSIIEVTDAETLYTDALTTNIRAQYAYKIADAQLVRAMGDKRVAVLKPGSIK